MKALWLGASLLDSTMPPQVHSTAQHTHCGQAPQGRHAHRRYAQPRVAAPWASCSSCSLLISGASQTASSAAAASWAAGSSLVAYSFASSAGSRCSSACSAASSQAAADLHRSDASWPAEGAWAASQAAWRRLSRVASAAAGSSAACVAAKRWGWEGGQGQWGWLGRASWRRAAGGKQRPANLCYTPAAESRRPRWPAEIGWPPVSPSVTRWPPAPPRAAVSPPHGAAQSGS